jgi:hypothetical protein
LKLVIFEINEERMLLPNKLDMQAKRKAQTAYKKKKKKKKKRKAHTHTQSYSFPSRKPNFERFRFLVVPPLFYALPSIIRFWVLGS